MRLTWAEIRANAARFAREWAEARYEKGETQSFYNDFFAVFGVQRRKVATFEEPVKKLGGRHGFIDLLWKGVLLVEHKSAGRDLARAREQALDYFPGLKPAELPRYVLVSDFQTFDLYDLEGEDGPPISFRLGDLPQHVERFGFILGVQRRAFRDQDPVNVEASELMGRLHDALKASGYAGHDLERLLVRLVFCLFADDTGIFEPRDLFHDLVERTRDDGRDLGRTLTELFEVLDTPEDRRLAGLDEAIAQFPYVNGALFAERLRTASWDGAMRRALLDACAFDWSGISPAIFGALFQSVMSADERRAAGAHYTTERNILKVIEPLFLDGLRAEFERLRAFRRGRREELEAFRRRLAGLTFFDPACGCGNFLVVAYRELRLLEMAVLRELRAMGRDAGAQLDLSAQELPLVQVDQCYGVEYDEFPARIAETAMWMMDHLMNNRVSLEFGQTFVRIPLRRAPHVAVGNALGMDWNALLPAERCAYVLGNPPFRGHQWRSAEQQADMARVWGTDGQVNRLDYVTCWFRKAVDYVRPGAGTEVAFVATNSITQGEQAGILWPALFARGASIRFAHRTFRWDSDARGTAGVHCVIVGLTFGAAERRLIYEYERVDGDPHVAEVARINGYLIDGPQYAVPARGKPPAGRRPMFKGSQPTDGARRKVPGVGYVTTSNLILDADERDRVLAAEPALGKWLRPYVGGDELISGDWRWCLWLKDADPAELRASAEVMGRLERVREGRRASPTASVQAFASFPTLFTQDRQPDVTYLAIPEVSSESREYIPMAMLTPDVVASNKLQIIPGADLFYFGVLTSAMHMAWMRTVAGRLESRYSYAPSVYNSFPWPDATDAQAAAVAQLAQGVLDARAAFPGSALDVLYDPDAMPPALRRAHQALDRAVDRLYRRGPFAFERERVEFLFGLYERQAAPLAPAPRAPRAGRR